MNMMPVSDAAKTALREAIAQEVAPTPIAGIIVRPDHGHDGDEVLWVTIFLEDDKFAVSASKLMSASVKAQNALTEHGDDRFALIDYASASEADQAAE